MAEKLGKLVMVNPTTKAALQLYGLVELINISIVIVSIPTAVTVITNKDNKLRTYLSNHSWLLNCTVYSI